MLEHVPELCGAVRGVDGDERQPGQRRAELEQHPLGNVVRPDGHALARLEALEQSASRTFGVGEQLGERPAPPGSRVLAAFDERSRLVGEFQVGDIKIH